MIEVLRLGHRPQRDKRITTHVCLTARAMGASRVRIAENDAHLVAGVRDVAARFGGDFTIEDGTGWKGPITAWQKNGGQVAHLTMYGEPLHEIAPRIDDRDLLIIVGAEKVPAEVYRLADHNVAAGHQPHSEVAALALLLDRVRGGQWEYDTFPGAEVRVVAQAHGKRVDSIEHRRDHHEAGADSGSPGTS